MSQKPRVLFLCTGNSARSQMAESLLRSFAGDQFEVFSAGLVPTPINPLTIQVMNEIGHSLEGQTSKNVKEFLGKVHFTFLITVCDEAERNCPTIWPGITTHLHWSFEDPAQFSGNQEDKIEKFREVRDLIKKTIHEWVASEI